MSELNSEERKARQAEDNMRLALLAAEIGYKDCERGINLQACLAHIVKVMTVTE